MEAPTIAERPITIVLADDHAVMRSRLRMLLDAEQDLEVVAEAGNVAGAFQHVRGHRPWRSISTCRGSSLEAIARLRQVSPGTTIVVLTMEEDPLFVRDALEAGASGYVRKHAPGTELVRTMRAAAEGGTELTR